MFSRLVIDRKALLMALVVALFLSSFSVSSLGDENLQRDTLTGDWGGLRTDLTKHGIDIDLRLSQYGQWVTDGGVDTNGEYGGTMDYRLNIDANKLFGSWEGLSIAIHARTRFGEDVNADVSPLGLQNTGMLMPSPGDYDHTDITGVTVSQYLPFMGGLANVTVGKIDVVDTLNGFFPSIGYGQEGFWNVNSMVTALPWFGAVRGLSLHGIIGITVNQEFMAPESGVLVLGTKNVATDSGSVSDSFEDGAFIAAFHRFYWKIEDRPGFFMVFAGGSTADQASTDPHDIVVVPGEGLETDEKKPWDVALYYSQELWRSDSDANRKVNFLTGGTVGPDNPQFSQYNYFAHLEAFGPFGSRPNDRAGVSFWWNSISDNTKDLVSPVTDLQNTWGTEVYYNVEITKWLHVSADLQFIETEQADNDLAVIPGIRMVIDF